MSYINMDMHNIYMLHKIWVTFRCINLRLAHNKRYMQKYNSKEQLRFAPRINVPSSVRQKHIKHLWQPDCKLVPRLFGRKNRLSMSIGERRVTWMVSSHFVNSHFVNSHFVNSHLVNFPLCQFPLCQFPFGQCWQSVNSHLVNVDKVGIDEVGIDEVGSWRSGNW